MALTLESFLAESGQFRLGDLLTERPHPKTQGLAELARSDLPRAIAAFAEVDRDAIAALIGHAGGIEELGRAAADCLDAGGRVFLCGCGATGRLAITLESVWRASRPDRADRVIGFMAGGDAALVRSVEGFEDHPEFGARHLDQLGFTPADLLIGVTEGGETSYVIGAAMRAAEVATRRPWLLYCNPDQALRPIERSRRAIDDPRIRTFSMPVGPMALTGSTRLQATTALTLAVGLALLGAGEGPRVALQRLLDHLAAIDLGWLSGFIEAEANSGAAGRLTDYHAVRHAITVLADTTERAPTFNLRPFENQTEPHPVPSPCYLVVDGAPDGASAWHTLLGRPPRPLDWSEQSSVTSAAWLSGFDFSPAATRRRTGPSGPPGRLVIARQGDSVELAMGDLRGHLPVRGRSLLEEQVLVRLLLNMHSTLVMGRLGRYRANVMTWVRPSNRKLIDRAIRYTEALLRAEGGAVPGYAELARACFAELAQLREDESIVIKTAERITRDRAG
ncbi:MAG TPA: SIS domain-containing protein [Kofleriaceae bacterium]|nr:SIS domain-containing protein [Kofleriaceae bacterium]